MTCYTRTPHEFGPQEIDLFSMLANQTALAIENARLLINSAVVREMHHRVKNNLQTVAMLLRLERGASADAQTCAILERAMGRVLSIAAVHETLSEQGLEMVAVKQVLERVARHVAELAADKEIRVDVGGEVPALPSRAATSLALIATELMQNAVTHGFRDRTGGQVSVTITADPREYVLRVADNGVGAGASATHAARARSGGSTSSSTRLGLEIVRTLVKHDLAGEFEMVHSDAGTCATIRFPTTTTRER
jgi:two-component sensor histidine kinase